jgi:DNA-binding MarR family transcriptional regulator
MSVATAASPAVLPAEPKVLDPAIGGAGRLNEQLCFALYAANNAMGRAFRPLLQQLGVTYPQYLVLLVLWEHRELRLGQIAEELDLATHAVSPIIDRLEANGFLVREMDPTDRRAVKVLITPAGAALEHQGVEIQNAARCRTQLSDEAVVALRTALVNLAESLGSK